MSSHPSEFGETARLWAIRVQDPSFGEWDRFTDWLESDPAHLAAYEAALDEAAWAASIYASAPRTPVIGARTVHASALPVPRRRWLPMAAAVVVLTAGWLMYGRSGAEEIVTGAGEHRTIALADGSRIILNGATRISFDPGSPRQVELAAGEALFEVHHDASDPFVVEVGDTRLVDVGTVFNVVSEGGALDLAVSHGAVDYQPGRGAIRVSAGEALSRAALKAEPVMRKVDPHAVGGWRLHQLQFDNAPLGRVAHELGRNIGVTIEAGAGSQDLHFTGTLAIEGTPEQVFARAGPLLGVRFAAQGDAWRMIPDHGPTP